MKTTFVGFAVGAFVALLVACAPTGGGIGKPPENAVCAWIQFPGERIYVCAAPDQIHALEAQAATARSKAGPQ
jgi:hypothetical protein